MRVIGSEDQQPWLRLVACDEVLARRQIIRALDMFIRERSSGPHMLLVLQSHPIPCRLQMCEHTFCSIMYPRVIWIRTGPHGIQPRVKGMTRR